MELIPAIDLLGGRVVRLERGDFATATDYGDPVETARRWAADGASSLHIVDLDGARSGIPVQVALVGEIVRAVGIPCQVAGGLRDAASLEAAFAAGAERVVLGTLLLIDPESASALVERFGADRIAGALDIRDGRAVGHGWRDANDAPSAREAIETLRRVGVRTIVVTAVARDGLLQGPDLALMAQARAALPDVRLIAAGGISSLDDLRDLARQGLDGAILGRALYDDRFSLSHARRAVGVGDDARVAVRRWRSPSGEIRE